jgi:hypothetical protein
MLSQDVLEVLSDWRSARIRIASASARIRIASFSALIPWALHASVLPVTLAAGCWSFGLQPWQVASNIWYHILSQASCSSICVL